MLGVILCGGQSSRMGTDKGLLKLKAKTWTQTAVDKMAQLQLPVVLSVNSSQYNSYSHFFSSFPLIKDNESLSVKGPLCGVLSVHLVHPSEDLFVLACDMPLMEASVLKDLYTIYTRQNSNEAFFFTNNDVPEPLCAIYTSRGLVHVIELQQTNQLTRHSMKFMLEQVKTFPTHLTDDQKKYFRNFNSHSELNGL